MEKTLSNAETQGYDIIIIDTAPQADQAALRVAKAASLVVVPVRPSIVDIDAIETTMDICAMAKREPLFVLNAVSPQGREAAEARAVIGRRGGRVAETSLGDRKALGVPYHSR